MNVKVLKISLLTFLLSSCAQVFFAEPQPQKGIVIKNFMQDVVGIYADTTLEVEVFKTGLKIADENYTLSPKSPLKSEVYVKFYRGFYFANFLDSIHYSVYMAKFYDDKLALYMLNADKMSIEKIQKITAVSVLDSANQTYLVNPTKKEFDTLLDYENFDVIGVLTKQK